MSDALGWRKKFGVIIPSTNTIVQPDFDSMRPRGVTNQIARALIPDIKIESDEDWEELVRLVAAAQAAAIESVLTCAPDRLILAISTDSHRGGPDAARAERVRLEAEIGIGVTTGGDASVAALAAVGARRVAVVTPYQPIGDLHAREFLEHAGFEVAAVMGLRGKSATQIAHLSEDDFRRALIAVDSADVDTLVQVGTNASMARLAAEAERWLGKPVIAHNTALYWHALRASGIDDRLDGFGSLLRDH